MANELENVMKSTTKRNNSESAGRILSFLEEKYIFTSWFVMVSDGNETEIDYVQASKSNTNSQSHLRVSMKLLLCKDKFDAKYIVLIELCS